jgi:apolipoprotein N-acyltransferase
MSELKQDWEAERHDDGRRDWVALAIALLLFVFCMALCFVGFIWLVVLSHPTRSKLLAIAALFVLMVGTGASGGLAFSVYHKIRLKRLDLSRPTLDPHNQVFIDRSGEA